MFPEPPTALARWAKVLAILLLAGGLVGFAVWYKLSREEPQTFGCPEDEFKYASIGTEAEEGLPY
jgi:hypothetical protein